MTDDEPTLLTRIRRDIQWRWWNTRLGAWLRSRGRPSAVVEDHKRRFELFWWNRDREDDDDD